MSVLAKKTAIHNSNLDTVTTTVEISDICLTVTFPDTWATFLWRTDHCLNWGHDAVFTTFFHRVIPSEHVSGEGYKICKSRNLDWNAKEPNFPNFPWGQFYRHGQKIPSEPILNFELWGFELFSSFTFRPKFPDFQISAENVLAGYDPKCTCWRVRPIPCTDENKNGGGFEGFYASCCINLYVLVQFGMQEWQGASLGSEILVSQQPTLYRMSGNEISAFPHYSTCVKFVCWLHLVSAGRAALQIIPQICDVKFLRNLASS